MSSIYERFELSPEEKKDLKEAQYFESLAHSPGWMKLKAYMASEVEQAFEVMAGNLSNDPVAYMRLQIRWQQRRAMMLGIIQHVESMVNTRNELIGRATEEPDEYEPTA